MKKVLAVLIIFASITLTACDSITIGPKKAATPQEFIELMYQKIDNSELSFEDIYNDEFANISKKMITAEEYAAVGAAQNEDILNTAVTATKITSVLEKEYADNISKVNTTLEYTLDGAPATRISTDYAIKINGSYKYLYRGILSKKAYKMATIDDSNAIHSERAVIYKIAGGIMIDLGMTNQTANNFSFGKDGGSQFDITTTDGAYSTTLPQAYVLNTNSNITLTANFDDAVGTVQKIKVYNIYTLTADGLPVETDGGKTYGLNVN